MSNCGIVDVGSNTIRLSIYQYDRTGFKLLLGKKETAGLAGYVDDGILSSEGIQLAAGILGRFRALADNLDIRPFYVFATASLRNISNTDEAVDAIQAAAGVPVHIITGSEEAILSFRGALFGRPVPLERGLLVDIGGGSTELVAYEGEHIHTGVSLPLGSLSLFTQHVSGLFPTGDEAKSIRRHVQKALDKAEDLSCSHLRGVGGTIRAAAKLCGHTPGQILSSEKLRDLYRQLKKGDQTTLRRILQGSPDRVHTILPGLIILNVILKRYGIETVDVSTQGVREGYLLTYVIGEGDPRVQGK